VNRADTEAGRVTHPGPDTAPGNRLVLVLGGARSGKSRTAEQLALAGAWPVTYVATAVAGDEEMAARIAHHKQRRPAEWRLIEEPYNLPAVFSPSSPPTTFIVDCLTIYISNWLLRLEEAGLSGTRLEEGVLQQVDMLLQAARRQPGLVVLVSNELGQGVVPPYPLGRIFRDIAGWANQKAAAIADEVYYCLAGIAIDLKQWQAFPDTPDTPGIPGIPGIPGSRPGSGNK